MGSDQEGCPRCGSLRVIYGYLKTREDVFGLNQSRFLLVTEVVVNTTLGWLFRRGVTFGVSIHFDLCVECGLLWNALDPSVVRKRLVESAGPKDLDRLGLIDKDRQMIDDLDAPI